ncbi:phosphoribosylformylglycinamidine synthase I [Candidatus Peregrinibacteria bacterium]|nr:phosphoribosylformylglycinamidine synthase I [Candidatus Peregrinibacteria bacterium]
MKTPKIAVIHFPGSNCELEALRACRRTGMEPQFVRWNEDTDLKKFDGFILPGGFSYEDRGRSGIVASKDPIIKRIEREALKEKPVIGICNGAQMLIECGLVPGLEDKKLEMALAWNEWIKKGKILGYAYLNDWIYIRSDAPSGRCAFNMFKKNTIIRCPVAHGEGRYLTQDKGLLKRLIANQQTAFRYCDEHGKFVNEFPINPNNAVYNLAGICNPEGNVMALMPHPERTPIGDPIFASMAAYIKKDFKIRMPAIAKKKYKSAFTEEKIKNYEEKPNIEMFVEMVITDNEERTIEHAIKDIGFKDIKLKKYTYFGIKTMVPSKTRGAAKIDEKALAIELIRSGELINTNKETPYIKIDGKWHEYNMTTGLIESKFKDNFAASYFVFERNNYVGKSILSGVRRHFGIKEVAEVKKGILWVLERGQKNAEKIVKTHIFHNPHSSLIFSKQARILFGSPRKNNKHARILSSVRAKNNK